MTKTYKQLREQLDEVLQWFESDDIDLDEAVTKHAEGEKIIAELTKYLSETEQKIKKATAKSQ
jgi:exodeoxyribonuclease VII small subunit